MNTGHGRIALLPAFGPQNDEAANDERAGHHHRGEQVRLDGLAKQQPQQHCRYKGDHHVQGKLARLSLRGQGDHGVTNFLPVHQDHRKDGAGLNSDVKHLGLVVVKAEQAARQNQVTGGRDGQEFGQSFDDTHEGGFEKQCNIHDVLEAQVKSRDYP